MEHIVGIKGKDTILGQAGFITWGRIFHPVDPQPLLDAVMKHIATFGLRNIESLELCDSLQEVAAFPYFYEALFEFSQNIIPGGKEYTSWKTKKKKEMQCGREIYFLGLTKEQKLLAKNIGGAISHGFYY